jgi:hypothetical protein
MEQQWLDELIAADPHPDPRREIANAFAALSETNKYRLLHRYEDRQHRLYHQSLQTLLRLHTKNDETNLIPFSNTAQSKPEPAPIHVKVYVEGGHDHHRILQTQCRRGFSRLFRNARLAGRIPRVIAGVGSRQALDGFSPVAGNYGRDHVGLQPPGATGDQIHLMVHAMEASFHAGKETMRDRPDIDNIAKAGLFAGLKQATKGCQKSEGSKGQDPFRILALTEPAKVIAASP